MLLHAHDVGVLGLLGVFNVLRDQQDAGLVFINLGLHFEQVLTIRHHWQSHGLSPLVGGVSDVPDVERFEAAFGVVLEDVHPPLDVGLVVESVLPRDVCHKCVHLVVARAGVVLPGGAVVRLLVDHPVGLSQDLDYVGLIPVRERDALVVGVERTLLLLEH